MNAAADSPADTSMMRIVHNALRRDLDRARQQLTRSAPADGDQLRAIGAHLGWLMHFLHAHHESEDVGLYPFVRARAADVPEHLRVLDRMGREHDEIAAAMSGVEAAGAALTRDPGGATAQEAVAALDTLTTVLLPHLREEEDEAMPIVSQLITVGEWQQLEQKHNLDHKSTAELGFEGHWLIDGVDEVDRATVLALVPPIPRFVLLHGFAGRYRRHAERCWGRAAQKPARKVQLANSVAVTVDADIDSVWDVVTDPTRIGEWSHECRSGEWLPGSRAAVAGARFRGRNRSGIFRWGRVCEVESADRYELRWRTLPTRLFPDSSVWQITLDRDGARTRISQRFEVVRGPVVLAYLYAWLVPNHRDRTAALIEDLTRLGSVAASASTARSAASG